MEWTDDDSARYIEATFPADDRVAVHELLATYGGHAHEREVPRVRRVLLQSCGGSLERLRMLVAMAKVDYRDVLTRDPGFDFLRP